MNNCISLGHGIHVSTSVEVNSVKGIAQHTPIP